MLARKARLAARGYTLVELVIVFIVIAIVVAVVIPLWPGKSIELSAQATKLAADLRYTQHLANTRGVRYKLTRINSTSYQIATVASPSTVIETVTLSPGISLNTFTPNNNVVFGTDGTSYYLEVRAILSIWVQGRPLSSPVVLTLTDGTNTKTITVMPETGMVLES